VLVNSVLPARAGPYGLTVEVVDYGLEASDLLAEPHALGVDEPPESVVGIGYEAGRIGQLAARPVALAPATTGRNSLELGEPLGGLLGSASGVADRGVGVGAGPVDEVLEVLLCVSEGFCYRRDCTRMTVARPAAFTGDGFSFGS
jgi:hypothetical protein